LVNSDTEDDEAEDEDSNDEANWRNDYPDEEQMSDNESIGERDMRQAMSNFDIGNDLSSDEEQQNGFVYSIDSEAINFEDDLDYCDVNRYGEAYARYKKRVVRELEGGSDDSEDDDSDDDNNDDARDIFDFAGHSD
jgi:Transcription factor Iwr1